MYPVTVIDAPWKNGPPVMQLIGSVLDGKAANYLQDYAAPLGLYDPIFPGWRGLPSGNPFGGIIGG
jgi:hypothetical protein